MASDPVSAELMLSVLTDGSYRHHVERLRVRLARAMETVLRRLPALGLTPWIEPAAGMFLWCHLPDGIDAANVARRAVKDGIVLAPGNVFSLAQSATGFLRLNTAQMQDERVYTGIARAIGA
jgi:DNA-binding transcriptional MocR family regulator